LKVLHLCNLPIPSDHPDYGRVPYHRHPGRWVLNLALAQKAHADIQPEILVQVPGASKDFITELEGVPVNFQAAPDRFRSATLFWFDTRRLIPIIRSLQPEVVHAHGTEDAYGLAAQRSRLPYVITAQGLHFLINRTVKPRLVSRERIVELMERRCLSKASDVIAKSSYVCEALAAEFPNLRLHEIPNTIDPRLFTILGEKKTKAIAFVGTIIPRKGLDLICDALAVVQETVPDITLWVFGDYPDISSEYENALKNRLRSVLGERVVFHGAVPSLELARRLATVAALVAPSREEMFGNQLIEALIVGTLGIVTEGTAMAENVRRFGGGIVVPQEDSKALAEAIVTAITNPPHIPTPAVRQRVREYMGPQTVARRHYDLYIEVLKGS
jgi:glycosyltransferase involved in cell wall biosynthesis